MRELRDILTAFERWAPDEAGVLATIVHAEGSTYRRVGARLLVAPDDEVIGLLSGGCLEGDLVAHAAEVRATGRPRVVRYDATSEEDIVWGLGLGCAGLIEVLLERVTPARPGPLGWLAAWHEARVAGVLATELGPDTLGRHWVLHADGRIERPGDAGEAGDEVVAAMRNVLETGRSRRVATSTGDVTVELVRPPRRLVVFGAGPDAVPVAALAVALGWDVSLYDHRPAHVRPERFPGARVHLAPAERAVADAGVGDDAYVLVMTHHYLVDRTLLADLMAGAAPYVGLLGPKQRAEDLFEDLEQAGVRVPAERRACVHAPAGLDVGGDGAEAIALSLVAEVMAVAEGRGGGWLQDRKGPIHDPDRA